MRTLRLDILALFLLLMLVTFASMMGYTYQKNKEVMLQASNALMQEVENKVRAYLDQFLGNIEKFASLEALFVKNEQDVHLENKGLLTFMLTGLQVIPGTTLLHISTPEGSALGFFQDYPKQGDFSIQFVDRRTDIPREEWIYKNALGQTIGEKREQQVNFDPRERPWYIGAEKSGQPFWTHVFPFVVTNAPGISLGVPLYDETGHLYAVAGGDIELSFLSEFLHKLQIAKNGKVILFDEEGKVIASSEKDESIPKVDVLTAYIPYILHSGPKWKIGIFIPKEDFLSGIEALQRKLYIFSACIILIACIFIAYFSKKVAHPIVQLSRDLLAIKNFDFEPKPKIKTHIKEIFLMQKAIVTLREAMKSFSSYVPKDIVKNLLMRGEEVTLGGKKKEVTLFFSGIKNFETYIEKTQPQLFMQELALYFDKLSDIIYRHGGVIDKFMGGEIMAFWEEGNTLNACLAAKECAHLTPFETIVGVHIGICIVGNIGTKERMSYTSIGDAVNIASRIRDANHKFGSHVLVSGEVKVKVGEKMKMRTHGKALLKGKTHEVELLELL